MTLYEINAEILSCLDMETGEIIDEKRLDELEMEKNAKFQNVACWVKNLEADAEAMRAEILKLQERIGRAERKAKGLKDWLIYATEGEKKTYPRAEIRFRISKRVQIPNAEDVPKKYQVKKVTYAPDKKAIKDAIESGARVKGAMLVAYTNVTIK